MQSNRTILIIEVMYMNNPNVELQKIKPFLIANECSPRHIQSVIEDLLEIAMAGEKLASSVSTLNPKCTEIGEGRLANLIDDANTVLEKIKI